MSHWFKITFADGTCHWLRSTCGWAGLISYIAKLPNEPKCNGATVRTATWWEGMLCCVRMALGDESCEEV